MTLREFMVGKPHGALAALARRADLSYTAIHQTLNGKPLKIYAKAKALSKATGWAVSIAELCEPLPPARRKRRGGRSAA